MPRLRARLMSASFLQTLFDMVISQQTVVQTLLQQRSTLLAYLWTLVRDQHIAEDLYQEVVVLALEKASEINDEEHLIRWAQKTAKFKAMNTLRKMQRKPVSLSGQTLELLDQAWVQRDEHSDDDMSEALRHCMTKLSPYASKLLEHRYVEGKTGQALANALGRTLNTTYTALSRIHRSLEACIRKSIKAEQQ